MDILENTNKEVEKIYDLDDPSSKNAKSTKNFGTIQIKYKFTPGKCHEGIANPYIRQPEKMYKGILYTKIFDLKNAEGSKNQFSKAYAKMTFSYDKKFEQKSKLPGKDNVYNESY